VVDGHGRVVRWSAAFGALLLFVATQAHATTVLPVTLAEMTAAADLVVEGWVAQVEPREEPAGIFTHVTLEGLRVIHGTHMAPTLELRFAGGEVNGVGERIAGMPTFAVGERVLLFVRGNGSELCPLVGWQQGRFDVVHDAATGGDSLTDGHGHPVIGVDAQEAVRYGEAAEASPRPVASPGVPDNEPMVLHPHVVTPPPAPMPLAAFLREIDRLRGVAPASSAPGGGGTGEAVAR